MINKARHDYRQQWCLKKGDVIEGKGETFIITGDPIGFGGSAILYPAEQKGSFLEYCIKECFPRRPEKYIRLHGVVRAENTDDELMLTQLNTYRDMLENEREIGQRIRNTSTRAIGIWKTIEPIAITTGGKRYTDVADGIYSVLERMDRKGMFFNELLENFRRTTPKESFRITRGLPNIYSTACIMEQTLLALSHVHKAGYLYGDIQGSNVFFSECDIEKGNVGIGQLIDFGSTRILAEDGLTEEIINGAFSTDGFRPPEICDGNGIALRLGKQADVYSAGCLMLRCVVSPHKVNMYGDSPEVGKDALDEVDGKAIGCSRKTLQLVNDILGKATMRNPQDRYMDASEMLKDIQQLKRDTEPPKYLLPPNLSSPDFFVPHSRDAEVSILSKAVNAGETVFLHGVGGIGKTTCAIALAKRLAPPRGAYLVHFRGTMKETILKMDFSGYKYEPKQKNLSLEDMEAAEYKERLGILQEHYRETILIVDNFDADNRTLDELRSEPAFKDLIGLDLNCIFTTRYPVEKKEWEIRELPEDALLAMMRYYCADSSITDEQYKNILKEIRYHTLTAMLIAKTIKKSLGEITPDKLLEAIRSSKLSQEEYPEVVSDQNRSYQKKQMYGHLKALFDLSGMNENDRIVLCCATLLPNDGMNALLFKRCLQKNEQSALMNLIERGWLTQSDQNEITIHPVIRDVCCEELTPNEQKCFPFLTSLIDHCDSNSYKHIQYRQSADCYARASNVFADINGQWANNAGFLYAEAGLPVKAMPHLSKALRVRECLYPIGHPALAETLDNIGKIYITLLMPETALFFFRRSMKIRKALLPQNHIDIAGSYSNMGSAYYYLLCPKKCLRYTKKALEIYSCGHSEKNLNIVKSLHCISGAYQLLCKYKKALHYAQQALELLEHTIQGNHPLLVVSYVNLGCLYGSLNMKDQCIEALEKAIEIAKDILPSDHPDLAKSYSHIAEQHYCRKEYQAALRYYLLEIEIWEGIKVAEARIADAYCNAGATYYKLGNMESALEYALKTVRICREVTHLRGFELGMAYFLLARIHFGRREAGKAISAIGSGVRYVMKGALVRPKLTIPKEDDETIRIDKGK